VAALAVGVALAVVPLTADAAARPSDARAVAPDPRTIPLPFPPGMIKQHANAVADDPVFGHKETRTRWTARDTKSEEPAWLKAFKNCIERVSEAVARGGRVLVWFLGAAALAAAIYFILRHQERWRRRRPGREVPQTLFGLDVRPASLPDDIVAAARAALAAGDPAAALGLLYRGALSALIHFAAVDFHPGDTESDCWRRAAPVLSNSGADYFRRLLDAWLHTAYAHRPPRPAALDNLCDEWALHFRRDAFAGGGAA
jgi:hypothetical protein